MKWLIFALAFSAVSCTHDLTAPLASVPTTNMAEYFWAAGITELLDSDRITTRDSAGLLLADDSKPSGAIRTTIDCTVSTDSVFAEGFRDSSLIDLNDGSEFVDGDPNSTGSYHTGGLLLLRANPLVDSSWRAGTLLVRMPGNTYKPFVFEARFLARLDSLDVDGVSYPDVLAVRYAYEHPDFSPDSASVPYWVIFYARGRGPIVCDKVGSSKFERRAILP